MIKDPVVFKIGTSPARPFLKFHVSWCSHSDSARRQMRIIEGDTGRWGTTGEVTRDFCLKPAGVCSAR